MCADGVGKHSGSDLQKVQRDTLCRSRLAGLLSRRNTASHRCKYGSGRSPSTVLRDGGAPCFSPLHLLSFLKEKSGPRGQSRKRRRQKDRDMLPTVALSTSGIRVKALPFLSLSAPLICVIWYALNYTSKKIIVNHCNYQKLVYSSDVKIDIGELTGQWAERGLIPSRPGYLIWIMPT